MTSTAPSHGRGHVIVLGAGGFIGANVMQAMMQRHLPVIGTTRTPNWRLAHLRNADIRSLDVTDRAALKHLISSVKPVCVINAAGYGVAPTQRDNELMRAVNVSAVGAIIEACTTAHVKRLIHLGSVSEYGDVRGPVSEAVTPSPKDDYGRSKLDATQLVERARDALDALSLRVFNTWGPLESAGRLIPSVIRACRTRTPLDLTAGTQIKDYTFVADLAAWITDLALVPHPYPQAIVNAASGHQISVRTLVEAFAKSLNGLELMRFGAKPMPLGEVQSGPVDIGRLHALVPHRSLTRLPVAIQTMLASPEPQP